MIIVVLSIVGSILFLPSVGMYYGFHNWTSSLTNGIVDARFIAIVNTALESPLGQVSVLDRLQVRSPRSLCKVAWLP